MARIIVLYSTVDGHTLEICERLQRRLQSDAHETTLMPLGPNTDIELDRFDTIVIGASIRYGKHRPEVTAFIERNVERLRSRPSAFFSVNVVARKPGKKEPHTNPYVRKFLQSISWKPAVLAIFAGKIDYPRYGLFDRNMIRLIMWITKGPTDTGGTFDFTDWDEVDAFAQTVSRMT